MPVMINIDIIPPIRILANMDALSNNHWIPPNKPLPIMDPSGPIAINVNGTDNNNKTKIYSFYIFQISIIRVMIPSILPKSLLVFYRDFKNGFKSNMTSLLLKRAIIKVYSRIKKNGWN